MNPLLTTVVAALLFACLAGCGQKVRGDNSADRVKRPVPGSIPASILGERVRGPVEVLEKPGGALLFTLADSTLVTCAAPEGGWCAVGLYMDLPPGQYGTDTLRRGRKIMVKGIAAGAIVNDLPVTPSTAGPERWAELTGYVPADRIYPFSVIETTLKRYMDTVRGRTVEALQPFIRSFGMEEDEALTPYLTYFTYESWINDPSPLPRVQLVFLNNKLIGVVHSRPLRLHRTAGHVLERGFRVLFFDDVPKDVKEDFIRRFNGFITSVD